MGVKRVYSWASGDAHADRGLLGARIESVLGGTMRGGPGGGKWWVECELLHVSGPAGPAAGGVAGLGDPGLPGKDANAAAAAVRELHVVRMGDTRDAFVVHGRSVLRTGPGAVRLMSTMARFQTRLTKRFEGADYIVGDFAIRVGTVSVGSHVQPNLLVVELEYMPCAQAGGADRLFEELLSSLLPSSGQLPAAGKVRLGHVPYADYGLSAVASLEHAALEYVLMFMNDRR